ncbi:MAG TPA: CoA transferase [Sphingomonas sp.]|jgi:crotonobetainyl-CoA:carnitine CoA-transferase CaiB-like acyl-CoA transferase|uniref:CaiB/BaiF CoA transferase family protein n=1 Tax=Sphingomonas sp. TaxID=28214 RepID=UPI002EDBA675
MKPLDGVRVLDFGRYIAGPYCAALLGDYGAEVIRVERIGGNEDRFPVPVAEDGAGAGFLQMNRNKKSLALSLGSEGGRAIVRRLVATADIVVANMPADALAKAGLDLASLRAIKPNIILVTATAFGEAGPMAGRVGFDAVGQAMSGVPWLTGTPDQPYRAQVNYVDFGTALHCAFGAMLALRERDRTGRGQQVSGSLLGTATAMANALSIDHALNGVERTPMGNRSFGSGPTDMFRTSDGWIITQIVSNPIFARWAKLVGAPELIDDPLYADDMARGDNGVALSERMAAWCLGRTTEAAMEALGAARIPAGPVLAPSQVMAHPQVQASGFVEQVRYPGTAAPAPIVGAPLTLSDSPRDPMVRAPQAGEHSASILAGIGFAADEIAALVAAGAMQTGE